MTTTAQEAPSGLTQRCSNRALQAGSYFILVSDAAGASAGGYLLGVEAIDVLEIWDDNADGKITCDEAAANNIGPCQLNSSSLPVHGQRQQGRGGLRVSQPGWQALRNLE